MKRKLLYCVETIGSGGVEQTRLTLVESLISEYEIYFICTQATGAVFERLQELGCIIYVVGELKSVFDYETYLKAIKFAKEIKPDLIHAGVFEGNLIASFISIFTNNKNLILEETSDPTLRTTKANFLLRMLSWRCKKFIGVSKASYDYLITSANVSEKKTININNGVIEKPPTSPVLLDEFKKKYELNKECFIVGTVCRLFDDHKKVSDLIKAAAMLIDSVHSVNVKLLVVGDGPDKGELVTLAEKLGIINNVIFTGYQRETRPFYDLMDVFVLPSSMEAFGLVLVEAMFAKLPIVATNVGGIPYVVREHIDAILVPANEPESIKNAIANLLDDKSLRANLGESGYIRAKDKFSSSRYVSDIRKLYESL